MKTILVDAIYAFIIEGEGIYQPMLELLEKYPNPKIVLTGAKKEDFEKRGIVNVPYEVFTLEWNPPKSDPEYYRIMLKHFNLKPEDVIYFEHNPEAIKSAESVGIKTYFYDEDKKDLVGLKKFLDANLK